MFPPRAATRRGGGHSARADLHGDIFQIGSRLQSLYLVGRFPNRDQGLGAGATFGGDEKLFRRDAVETFAQGIRETGWR